MSSEMSFNNRVIIYCEDLYSASTIDKLKVLYESKGLHVLFRGFPYVLKRFGDKP